MAYKIKTCGSISCPFVQLLFFKQGLVIICVSKSGCDSRIIRIRVFGIRLLLVNPIRNSVSKGVTFRYSIVLGVNMTRQHFTDLLSHQRERHILAHTPQLTANEDSTDGVERSLEAPESHWYPTSAIVIRCSHTQQRRPKEKSNGRRCC